MIEHDLTLEKEEIIYRSIMDKFDGQPYDYGAFLYFAWRVMLWKVWSEPLPKMNPWNSKTKFLCTEMAEALPEWMFRKNKGDYSIVPPHELFLLARENP